MAYTRTSILDGRKVVDAYRLAHAQLYTFATSRLTIPQEHSPLIQKMQDGLRALGFASEDDFREANNELCAKDMGYKSMANFEAHCTGAEVDPLMDEFCGMWH